MTTNTIHTTGNLCADPELRYTNSGKPVANFRIAVNEYRGPDKSEHVEYFNVVVWDSLAENLAMCLGTGDRVMVAGKLRVRSYADSNGDKQFRTEINADEVGVALRWATVDSVERTTSTRQMQPAGGSDRGDSEIYGDEPF